MKVRKYIDWKPYLWLATIITAVALFLLHPFIYWHQHPDEMNKPYKPIDSNWQHKMD